MKINLFEFLKTYKVFLLIRRSITAEKLYSCEIQHGWLKNKNFYLNAIGIGNTETEAINDLIRMISGEVVMLNIDTDERKRMFNVPPIHFLKEKVND